MRRSPLLLGFFAFVCGMLVASIGQAASYPNVIVYSTVKVIEPGGVVHCGVVTFDEFDDIPGATNYASHVYDNGGLVTLEAGGIIPFYGDSYQYVTLHVAPAGRHRFVHTAFTSESFRPTCGEPDRTRFVAAGVDVDLPGQPPLARFSFSYDQNDPQLVLFDGSRSKGTIVSYDWDFGDGEFGTGVQTTHRFVELGTYSVKLTVTNDQGIGDIVRHDVRNNKPLLVYTPVSDPKSVAMGDSFTLDLEVRNNGSQPMTGVAPTGPPAAASDDGADVQLTGGPQPAGSLTLAPGEVQTFAYDYQAVAAGKAVFTAQIQGSNGDGGTVTAKSTCIPADPGCGRVTITDQTIVVNSVGGARLAAGSTSCDTGDTIMRGGKPEPECTFMAAGQLANGRPGLDYISFDIPNVSGLPEIGFIPSIDDPVVIDGTTQPGAGRVALKGAGGADPSNASLLPGVCSDPDPLGTAVAKTFGGLLLDAGSGGSEIRGLAVYGFGMFGIRIEAGSDGNTIADNLIGTDGTSGHGNGTSCTSFTHVEFPTEYLGGGVVVASSGNIITGNVFRGNGSVVPFLNIPGEAAVEGIGLRIVGGNNNVVQGNSFEGGRGGQAVQDVNLLIGDGSGNLIGGSSPDEGNTMFAGFNGEVRIAGQGAKGNLVQGNVIGDGPGYTAGIEITDDATQNVVGGYAPGEANVVPNVSVGFRCDQNRVIGNFVGIGPSGRPLEGKPAFAFANGNIISKAKGTVIASNRVSNADASGIFLEFASSDSRVLDNEVFANGLDPEVLNGRSAAGIAVLDGTGHVIRRNRIYANGGLGIDLGADGPDGPGDVGDGDVGPNNKQNTAIITSVVRSAGRTLVYGTVRAPLTGSAPYTIDVFENNSCDPSGWGEGQSVVGSAQTTNAYFGLSGSSNFIVGMSGNRAGYFSATATDANGNTSEFSRCTRSEKGSSIRSKPLGSTLEVFDPSAFSAGDQVTICPGCPTEETNEVAAWRSFTRGAGATGPGYIRLANATQFSHGLGEVVAVDSTPIPPACGDRLGDGVKASDALYVLQVAVGSKSADECVADVDGDGSKSATDALIVLQVAVGQTHPMLCPICF